MTRVLVVTHPGGGTSGVFAQAAAAGGQRLEEWSPAGGGSPAHALEDYDALVVLGGDQNVCERDRLPYLEEELDLIARWLDGGRPLLGVCLGAQLLAHAAGGAVVRAEEPELGWYDVTLTAAGHEDPVLGFGPQPLRAFQWHSYVARPPDGASLLARSDGCLQAFRSGAAWGVQYHPEVTREIVDEWIDETRADGDGPDPAAAFGDLSATLAPWTAYGRELFARWAAQAR
jgi:GMP synthase (glutamine-hydrolysing)